jgi:hypothetical protein
MYVIISRIPFREDHLNWVNTFHFSTYQIIYCREEGHKYTKQGEIKLTLIKYKVIQVKHSLYNTKENLSEY